VDLHHNLFYSYRGSSTDAADRDRQLENNLTKALINTLALGGESVWRPFLADLGLGDALQPSFLLQRRDLPSGSAAKRRRRVLLGIAKQESDWFPDEGVETTGERIPDAWIYGDGFAILVESKIGGGFSPGQMQGHVARLQGTDDAPPRIVLKTWGQIYGFFRGLLPSLKDARSHLLVTQLAQFLEFSGMTAFTGFRSEHFDYFILHDDDDARRWIRGQVDSFAAQVLANLRKAATFYDNYDVGNLKLADSYCWVAFGPKGGMTNEDNDVGKDKAYRKVTHQSLSLHSDGLRVFVNVETKPATDRVKAVLSQSATADALRRALRLLHKSDPFDLILEERIQKQASKYDYVPKMRLHSSMLTEKVTGDLAWRAFDETVKVLPLPYLRIERTVPRKALLEHATHDPAKVVQHVIQLLLRNHAVVTLLNMQSGVG
jgi:hypothetical protein